MDKLLTLIKNNSKKITIVGILIIILVILIVLTIAIIKENEKQKYVVYNGKNLSESKYPGYKEKIIDVPLTVVGIPIKVFNIKTIIYFRNMYFSY